MRSARSSEGSRYKIFFIIAVLLLAIVCVLYVLKMQEVSALSQTLDEAKKEANSAEWGLNHKVSELQQKLETQTVNLKECEKKVTALGKECNTSKQLLDKCGGELASLQKTNDGHEEQLKVAHDRGVQLESKVAELQDALSAEQKTGDTCKLELAESQGSVDKCSESADAIKAQLTSCLQRCPAAGDTGNPVLNNPMKREQMQGMHFGRPVAGAPALPERESLIGQVAPGEAQELQKDYDSMDEEKQNPGNLQSEFL